MHQPWQIRLTLAQGRCHAGRIRCSANTSKPSMMKRLVNASLSDDPVFDPITLRLRGVGPIISLE